MLFLVAADDDDASVVIIWWSYVMPGTEPIALRLTDIDQVAVVAAGRDHCQDRR